MASTKLIRRRPIKLRLRLQEILQRMAMRRQLEREIRSLQSLSDEHLRDIGLYRSDLSDAIVKSYDRDLLRKRVG